MDWISQVCSHVTVTCGIEESVLVLTEADANTLLDLAGLAAHSTGDRTNAPLLCYVLGLAVAGGASLDDLARSVREFSGGG